MLPFCCCSVESFGSVSELALMCSSGLAVVLGTVSELELETVMVMVMAALERQEHCFLLEPTTS